MAFPLLNFSGIFNDFVLALKANIFIYYSSFLCPNLTMSKPHTEQDKNNSLANFPGNAEFTQHPSGRHVPRCHVDYVTKWIQLSKPPQESQGVRVIR